jgi:hypothetical protein
VMKPSPIGFKSTPNLGHSSPTTTPSKTPIKT